MRTKEGAEDGEGKRGGGGGGWGWGEKEKQTCIQKSLFKLYKTETHAERKRVIADSSPMVQGAYAVRMRLTILWLKN